MGLKNIFDNENDQGTRKNDDIVGRFRSGAQVNDRPMALDAWRITTGDPEVAEEIARLFGGEPQEWDTKSEEKLEVYTDQESIDIVLDGTRSVRSEMVLWGKKGKIRSCDGATQKNDEKSPCACPSALPDRKEAAREGHGCEPSVGAYFYLKDAPELGKFKFFSGSWNLARDIADVESALADIDGPAFATLRLEEVSFEAKSGPRKGKTVTFTKPVFENIEEAPEDFLGEEPF